MAPRALPMSRTVWWLVPIGIAGAMVTTRQLLHQPAILVPEAAAVSAGMLVWKLPVFTHRPLATASLICLAAFGGVQAARYLALPEPALIAITTVAILGAFVLFDLPALPALSAGLLPVYLHIVVAPYVVSVALTMLPVALVAQRRRRAERRHFRARELTRIAPASAALVAVASLNPFFMLPPLYVATTEAALGAPPPAGWEAARRSVTLASGFAVALMLHLVAPMVVVALGAVTSAIVVSSQLGVALPPALAFSLVPLLFPVTDSAILALGGLIGSAAVAVLPWIPSALGRAWVLLAAPASGRLDASVGDEVLSAGDDE